VSKSKDKQAGIPQQALLDADLELQAAADAFGADDDGSDATRSLLREAALGFAAAWHACGGGKARP